MPASGGAFLGGGIGGVVVTRMVCGTRRPAWGDPGSRPVRLSVARLIVADRP